MFSNFVSQAQSRLEKRRRYQRLVGEIMSMSNREISDLRGDRGQMLHDARKEIYG